MPVATRLNVNLHPGQQRAQASEKKVVAVIAGTGGGKTAYAPLWVLTERAKIAAPPRNITQSSGIVVAPYKILRRTTMPTFLRLFQHKLGLGQWESRQDGIWRFHDGGYVYFCSADTPESIEGAHVHWAMLDEAGQRQFPEESFRAVERRVRFHEGRILITTTPYVLGWLKRLSDSTKLPADDPARRDDVEIITFPSVENPKFPKAEFERARATLPPWMFRMFYMGEWDRPAGLVYSMLSDEHWINSSDLPAKWQTWPGYSGIDFGYNNPHVNLYGALEPVTDILYIFDEYYEVERTNADNARQAPHKEKVAMAWADPSAPEAIAEFVQQRWRVTACPKHEVLDGLKEVFERLLSGRLIFVRGRLTETSKELDSYVWDDKQPDRVMKVYDHTMDALRYLCAGLRSIGAGRASTLPEQGVSPGRMGQWKLEDTDLIQTQAAGSAAQLFLGTRTGQKSRLAGLPKSSISRRRG